MTLRKLGCALSAAASVVLLAEIAIATYVPPPHAIHSADARAVSVRGEGGWLLPYRGRVPAATKSLGELRCALWSELTRQSCDGATFLAERVLPSLTQTPATLYLPLASAGGYSNVSGPSGYNVEFLGGQRRLVVHDYVSQPLFVWYHADSMPGAALAPGLSVLAVSTAGMQDGVVNLQEDFWIERVNGDEMKYNQGLGTVEI